MKLLAGEMIVHEDAGALASAAASDLLSLARDAIEAQGRVALALTGGSSPMDLYRLLGEERIAHRMPWSDVHIFWGDDRVVGPAHPRSNYRLANGLFIERVDLPSRNIHRIHGELGARRAAKRYSDELREFFGGWPRLDLVHLGLGDDGHVASLFPFQCETLLEREEVAIPALYRELGEWRVTLTYPVLNSARRVEFLVPSASKARIARAAMAGPIDPIRIPAQGVRSAGGDLLWRLTEEVATRIGSSTG